jgi:hypothetical protein
VLKRAAMKAVSQTGYGGAATQTLDVPPTIKRPSIIGKIPDGRSLPMTVSPGTLKLGKLTSNDTTMAPLKFVPKDKSGEPSIA